MAHPPLEALQISLQLSGKTRGKLMAGMGPNRPPPPFYRELTTCCAEGTVEESSSSQRCSALRSSALRLALVSAWNNRIFKETLMHHRSGGNTVHSSISRVAALVLLSGTAMAQTQPVDTAHSVITVRVFKSGLFSAFADNHEIRAPVASGFLDQAGNRVELVVNSRELVVLDPNLAMEKRQQVQERMLGPEVLDSNQFHEIRFEGNNVKQEAPADRFLVAGTLWLHGKTGPISLHVTRSNGHYRGETVLKQRDFGIPPVNVAGGTVKVKDELKIEFDIVAVSASYRAATEP